jgi:hypothetical protein
MAPSLPATTKWSEEAPALFEEEAWRMAGKSQSAGRMTSNPRGMTCKQHVRGAHAVNDEALR